MKQRCGRSALSLAVAAALHGGAPIPAHAQTGGASEPLRVDVTGSRIARTDGETALPCR